MKIRIRFLFPLVCAATASLLAIVPPAQAGYIVTLTQQGPNVVASGSGTIDLTGLIFNDVVFANNDITPNTGSIRTGPFSSVNLDTYAFVMGPTSFGNGFGGQGNTGSGDMVGITGVSHTLYVPEGYLSGAALSNTMTVSNATFASLGVTPGTYVWTWGSGADQNFTLIIGRATVPDHGSTVGLLILALIALFGASRFRLGLTVN